MLILRQRKGPTPSLRPISYGIQSGPVFDGKAHMEPAPFSFQNTMDGTKGLSPCGLFARAYRKRFPRGVRVQDRDNSASYHSIVPFRTLGFPSSRTVAWVSSYKFRFEHRTSVLLKFLYFHPPYTATSTLSLAQRDSK